jgi:predicted DNA-binding transcriptional regulator YafY
MKVERLISILMLLLNKRKLTAKELSGYFEVSIRTIQRDMDTLCNAGIPIYGDVGKYGGYQLTENYKLDRNFLTGKEMDTLVTMLKGFSDTLFSDSIRTILEKMGGFNKNTTSLGNLHIDMTPWGADKGFLETLNLINNAIEEKRLISFEYYDLYNNKTIRQVEPYISILKVGSWYIYAYCLKRKEYRVFKISRIFELRILQKTFEKRDNVGDPSQIGTMDLTRESSKIKIRFSPDSRGKIPDFFDPRIVEEDEMGRLIFDTSFPIDEWLISVIMSFGGDAEVLEPESLRKEIIRRIKKSYSLYQL